MKKVIVIAAALFLMQTSIVFAETYAVDTAASEIKWTATKMTGKHFGTIHIASGKIEMADGKFTGGEAVVDSRSIVIDDIKDEKGNAKLLGHLKSADFFDVENFPEAKIRITGVMPAGENLYDVTADLTIKGITQLAFFKAKVEKSESGVHASATIQVDRTLYGIRYGSGKFFENLGDKTIHDIFTLDVSVSAK